MLRFISAENLVEQVKKRQAIFSNTEESCGGKLELFCEKNMLLTPYVNGGGIGEREEAHTLVLEQVIVQLIRKCARRYSVFRDMIIRIHPR